MEGRKIHPVSVSLPICLFAVASMLAMSKLLRSPLGFLIAFGVIFGLLVCLRAVVRARAKRKEA